MVVRFSFTTKFKPRFANSTGTGAARVAGIATACVSALPSAIRVTVIVLCPPVSGETSML
ncbi:MAG: hypothetical protein EB033_13565 [Proteobacteria bacterium]|nr:hypothetical protein [Pseudomonadota bacterium]